MNKRRSNGLRVTTVHYAYCFHWRSPLARACARWCRRAVPGTAPPPPPPPPPPPHPPPTPPPPPPLTVAVCVLCGWPHTVARAVCWAVYVVTKWGRGTAVCRIYATDVIIARSVWARRRVRPSLRYRVLPSPTGYSACAVCCLRTYRSDSRRVAKT